MKGKRKVRSDKKRDIKPTIDTRLKETIFRLAFITDTPAKDVAEQICLNALRNKKVLDQLSKNFKRTIQLDNTIYMGDINRIGVSKQLTSSTERMTIRFKQASHGNIATLAYALDSSLSRACALLLELGIRDFDFVNEFVKTYIVKNVDEERVNELKRIMNYVNVNENDEVTHSWSVLLLFIIEETKETFENIQDRVSEFIQRWND